MVPWKSLEKTCWAGLCEVKSVDGEMHGFEFCMVLWKIFLK